MNGVSIQQLEMIYVSLLLNCLYHKPSLICDCLSTGLHAHTYLHAKREKILVHKVARRLLRMWIHKQFYTITLENFTSHFEPATSTVHFKAFIQCAKNNWLHD